MPKIQIKEESQEKHIKDENPEPRNEERAKKEKFISLNPTEELKNKIKSLNLNEEDILSEKISS